MGSRVVCVTTFRQGSSNNPVELTRAEVFLDSAKNLNSLGIPCVALLKETQIDFIDSLKPLGIIPVNQQSMGMGNIRREAINAARSLFPNTEFYCWLEPEKPDLPRFISPMVTLMSQENSGIGLFNRIKIKI